MESKHKALVSIVGVIAISLVITMFTDKFLYACLICAVLLATLFITKSVWLSESHGRTLIRRYSLFIILAIASTPFYTPPLIGPLIKPILEIVNRYSGLHLAFESLATKPTIDILIFTLVAVFIVNYFNRDPTAMGKHSIPLGKEFPDKSFKERLLSVSKMVKEDIDKMNRETSWSEEYFTNLDAEVEVKTDNKRNKRITDLLSAIKNDKSSKVFLVLGDPGSGKSVSLRKLCSELLKEVTKTEKLPIYVNLREWELEGKKWSKSNPPKSQDLQDFIIKNLKSKGDYFFCEFIDKYFLSMMEHGRVFFLLDSFDEIPSVMDLDESHWLIDELSSVIYRFLGGAQDSRGILASRIFRKPTRNFNARTTLEIRPFTERKISDRFKKSISYDPKIDFLIFNERQEYVNLASNPFMASLIMSYAKSNDFTLPKKQVDLYESYVDERLNAVNNAMLNIDISKEQVIVGMTEIAYFMFSNQQFGLEAPLSKLIDGLKEHRIKEIIDIAVFSRLGRKGSGDNNLFSFVHRRFNEFFVAKKLISNPALVNVDSIPNDSRWRDSLVLYCELAGDSQANSIADFCWGTISKSEGNNTEISDSAYLASVHSLRFLRDAFRNRKDALVNFTENIGHYIIGKIDSKKILESKLSIEAVSLIDEKKCEIALIKAIDIGNPWITENSIRSCRHLTKISNNLEEKLCNFVYRLSFRDVIQKSNDLLFSLSLSQGFKKPYFALKLVRIDMILLTIGLVLATIVNPALVISTCLLYTVMTSISNFVLSSSDDVNIVSGDKKESKKNLLESFAAALQRDGMFLFQCRIMLIVGLFLGINEIKIFSNDTSLAEKIKFTVSTSSVVCVFPWIYAYRFVNIVRNNFTTTRLLVLTLLMAVGTGIFYIISFLISLIPLLYKKKLLLIVASVFFLYLIYEFFRIIIRRKKDLFTLKRINITHNVSRKIIQRDLEKLKNTFR